MKDTLHHGSDDVGAITQQALGDKRVDFSVLQQFIAGEGEKTIVQDLLEKEKSRLHNTYKDVDIANTMAQAPDMFRELDHREKINRVQLLALAKKIVPAVIDMQRLQHILGKQKDLGDKA